ncbi:MAG: hypothetical protein IPP22_15625 [Nitrosomonas sp.]|nr:hypothetical protein [Nitrosomonas sp.]
MSNPADGITNACGVKSGKAVVGVQLHYSTRGATQFSVIPAEGAGGVSRHCG